VTSRLGEFHVKRPNIIGAISLERDSLVASWLFPSLGQLGDASAFQLSIFIFVYSPFAQLSPFFPRTLKLTQTWK